MEQISHYIDENMLRDTDCDSNSIQIGMCSGIHKQKYQNNWKNLESSNKYSTKLKRANSWRQIRKIRFANTGGVKRDLITMSRIKKNKSHGMLENLDDSKKLKTRCLKDIKKSSRYKCVAICNDLREIVKAKNINEFHTDNMYKLGGWRRQGVWRISNNIAFLIGKLTPEIASWRRWLRY